MVLKKKSLTHILEENHNNKPEEAAPPLPPQTSQHIQTQAAQPPASAPRQVSDQIG